MALKLRVSANRISEILRGRRGISAETALRLARCFGNSPEFRLNLQTHYDLAVARRDIEETVAREVEVV
ncbi:MAG: HigA family addiction module antitoxin [Acetobacteraceae bacterium]